MEEKSTLMFTAALFIISNMWNQPVSINERIDKKIKYVIVRRREPCVVVVFFLTKLINLENIMFSHIN